MTEPAAPPGGVSRAAPYALVLLLTVLLAVWGAFLVPLRVAGVAAPVCWLVALVTTLTGGTVGGRLGGRGGTAVPVLVWLVVALTLGSRRTEGDLVVPGTTTGLVFLLAGAVGGAVAFALQVRRAA